MAENNTNTMEQDNSLKRGKEKLDVQGKITAGRYDIYTTNPLSQYSHQYAEAYECYSNETGQSDHVAIVIKGRFPARKDFVDVCFVNDIPGLMSLRTTVVIDWPDGNQRYAIIFKRPEGHPIFQHNNQRREPLSEEVIRRGIMRPLFQTMLSMANHELVHGNIRPENIFLQDNDNSHAVLGECISSAPGALQPVLYETIERGMTDPEGRGAGTELDDIYSFGATIAILLRGHSPFEGKNDRFIIEEKINRGSFAAFTDGLRLSPGLAEFLRAALNDDMKQRWDMDQLGAWIDGNRATPKQSPTAIKAQRSLDFNGKKYVRPRMVAKDLFDNIEEAVMLIESGNLMKWVDRALGDATLINYLGSAINRAGAGGRSPGYEDRLLCYVSMALDPMAPIRFKNLKILPTGIGHSMAVTVAKNENLQNHGELIRDRYAWTWLGYKENFVEEYSQLTNTLDQASKNIVRRGINYGMERCLYELCLDAPCLSDYFKEFYVVNCEVLLYALNDVAKKNKDMKAIDRHIASYITVHDIRDNAGLMLTIESSEEVKRSLALITLYQQLQRRFNNPKLVDLCTWLAKDAESAALRFKNEIVKQNILKQIQKEASTGNLTRLLTLVDNPAQVKKDTQDFARATQHYATLDRERDTIQTELSSNPNYGFSSGRRVALTLSLIASVIMILSTLAMHFGGMR